MQFRDLPETPFVVDNQVPITRIFEQLRYDFPKTGAAEALGFDEDGGPTAAAMSWMWRHLMGRQHGTFETDNEKVMLPESQEKTYGLAVAELHYGRYTFNRPTGVKTEEAYTKGLAPGGTPEGMVNLLGALVGKFHIRDNIQEIVLMAGQRLRWDIPSERSPQALYDALGKQTGVDMDDLRKRSPWLSREESQQTLDDWRRPFATEFEIGRAVVETVFRDNIDWKNYPVEEAPADDTTEPFLFNGIPYSVPEREVVLVTYHLKNGMVAHVLNGRAVNRARGVPRPTSESQTLEITQLLAAQDETMVVASGLPHVRAGLDVTTQLVHALGDRLQNVDLSTADWPRQDPILLALGEIPATHKADIRLRAALHGDDPNTPDLLAL